MSIPFHLDIKNATIHIRPDRSLLVQLPGVTAEMIRPLYNIPPGFPLWYLAAAPALRRGSTDVLARSRESSDGTARTVEYIDWARTLDSTAQARAIDALIRATAETWRRWCAARTLSDYAEAAKPITWVIRQPARAAAEAFIDARIDEFAGLARMSCGCEVYPGAAADFHLAALTLRSRLYGSGRPCNGRHPGPWLPCDNYGPGYCRRLSYAELVEFAALWSWHPRWRRRWGAAG